MQIRGVVRFIAMVTVLQGLAIAQELCDEPLDTYLDEGIQRALIASYKEDLPTEQPNEDADDADLQDCRTIIEELAVLDDDPDREVAAPSLVPPRVDDALAQRGAVHQRWYMLTNRIVMPDQLDAAPRRPDSTSGHTDDLSEVQSYLFDQGFSSDDMHLLKDIDVLLVHAQTMRLFSSLISEFVRYRVTHVMENYPFYPALSKSSREIGVQLGRTDNLGAGYAIAIIDTGVEKEMFGERIIYEACFSSYRYQLTSQDETYSTCNNLPNEVHSDLGNSYVPDSAFGEFGGPCKGYQPTFCDHGSNVAYVAAGGDLDDTTHGVAPRAAIIAIQASSIVPAAYCDETGDSSSCALFMPTDVLRALGFLERSLRALAEHEVQPPNLVYVSPGRDLYPYYPNLDDMTAYRLAAVNLSFETYLSCEKIKDTDAKGACQANRTNETETDGPYQRTCYNAFSLAIEHLRSYSVYTVVAAGNKDENDVWGSVSNPACAKFAVSVGSWKSGRPDPVLYERSRYADELVTFLAPGLSVEYSYDEATHSLTGTSYAAPFVSGALALVQERLKQCGRSESEALVTLEENRQSVDLPPDASSQDVNLGLNLDFDPCYERKEQ